MKITLATGIALILTVSACTKTGNTIAPTNSITITSYAGTTSASSNVFNSVPSTTVLANGTPFTITAYDVSGTDIKLELINPNCIYPNFISGTYSLCNNSSALTIPPLTPCACASGTKNSIAYGPNNVYRVKNNTGTVVVNFNNGTATGTFSYNAYKLRSQFCSTCPIDTFSVIGSFSVGY